MPDQERELSPEQEAEVGRLLADARATEPLPAEVAARLERVLIGLGEERGGTPVPGGNVIALASRRRRASIVLVAAAAVVAIGVGVGQVVSETGTSGDDAGVSSNADGNFAESPADRGAAEDEDSAGGGRNGQPEAAPSEVQSEQADTGSTVPPVVPATVGRVRQDSFTADANQLRRAIPDGAVEGEFVELAVDQLPRGYVLTDRPFDCAPAAWGAGVLVPVFYDGTPAVLAYRPVAGESQVVDVVQCGTGDKLRSATLRAG